MSGCCALGVLLPTLGVLQCDHQLVGGQRKAAKTWAAAAAGQSAAAELLVHVPGPPLLGTYCYHASASRTCPARAHWPPSLGSSPTSPHLPHPPLCSAKLKLDRLRRRGKAPPKKGAGKRAGKKK